MQAAINPIADRISSISVSSTMKVSAEADRLRNEGVDVVDFGAGEPDFPTPDNIKQAAVRALDQNFTKYTAAGGTAELKKAICERHTADFGTDYKPAECIVSVGGSSAASGFLQIRNHRIFGTLGRRNVSASVAQRSTGGTCPLPSL